MGGLVVGFIVFVVLLNLLVLAFSLPPIIEDSFGIENPVGFVNANLLYFFVAEFLSRFLLQKLPVIELEKFLHLPLKRSSIVHFLLGKSVISSFSLIALICFGPFSFMVLDMPASLSWLMVILLLSFSMHWVVLWYKQQFGDNLAGTVFVFLLAFAAFGTNYYGYFNVGNLAAPFFNWAMNSYIPVLIMLGGCFLCYRLAFHFYIRHSYVEELTDKTNLRLITGPVNFLSRFGLAGEIADLEWRLILRHKKSRTYLLVTFLFLFYGLLLYTDPALIKEEGFSYMYIFVGAFITASFMAQYGQLFLSWNSAAFDFYLTKFEGIRALIKGKYLLFLIISTICFLLTVPYVYFGWDVLLVHTATFLFNIGVSIHTIVYISLWKPQPVDLNKGGLFNYEGMGIAQFLIAIPLLILPYVVFLPFAFLYGDYFGLAILAGTGILGLVFYERLVNINVNKLNKNRHQISAAFRQEL